ncbi:hypothetical protein, partial [Leptospira gomenensis]
MRLSVLPLLRQNVAPDRFDGKVCKVCPEEAITFRGFGACLGAAGGRPNYIHFLEYSGGSESRDSGLADSRSSS